MIQVINKHHFKLIEHLQVTQSRPCYIIFYKVMELDKLTLSYIVSEDSNFFFTF